MGTSVYDAARDAANWLDERNGCGAPELALRVAKVAEEAGEAIGAWIGLVGQNPRKGVTHNDRDVADELADAAFAALVAIESLGLDAETVMVACAAKASARAAVEAVAR